MGRSGRAYEKGKTTSEHRLSRTKRITGRGNIIPELLSRQVVKHPKPSAKYALPGCAWLQLVSHTDSGRDIVVRGVEGRGPGGRQPEMR